MEEPTTGDDLAPLRRSLQRLALAGSEQPPLFPEEMPHAGMLAAEFDRCAAPLSVDGPVSLTVEQSEAIAALSRKLRTMSRDGADFDADLWTEAALRTSEHWADVRRLASAALETFPRADER